MQHCWCQWHWCCSTSSTNSWRSDSGPLCSCGALCSCSSYTINCSLSFWTSSHRPSGPFHYSSDYQYNWCPERMLIVEEHVWSKFGGWIVTALSISDDLFFVCHCETVFCFASRSLILIWTSRRMSRKSPQSTVNWSTFTWTSKFFTFLLLSS